MASDLRQFIRRVQDLGLKVEMTRGNHHRVRDPDSGRVLTSLPLTPSDWRGLRNAEAALRRQGFCLRTMRRVPPRPGSQA